MAAVLAAGNAASAQSVLVDRYQVVTTPTGACIPVGRFASEVQLGNGIAGFSNQLAAGANFRIADNFQVGVPDEFELSGISFFAYQSNASATTPTMTAVNFRIWSGQPGQPGSTVVYGDTTTNTLQSSVFTQVYRYINGQCSITRPVWENRAAASGRLGAGHYWLDWQTQGTLASGPFAVPITITGQQTIAGANGLQFNGTSWISAVDSGDIQDFPFVIRGWKIGDMNCDGAVNCSDVDPFVEALVGNPVCRLENGDTNNDGEVNFFDIDAFRSRLGGVSGGVDCPAAVTIGPGTTVGSNAGGFTTTVAASTCLSNSAECWYRHVPATSGSLTMDTCGSSFDTVLTVYSGCPGNGGSLVACNNNAAAGPCMGSLQSRVSFGAAGGTAYYIRVSGTRTASTSGACNRGAFQLNISGGPAPCYANCDGSAGAPVLTANDFQCFLNEFVAAHSYANCDGVGGLTANDFQCFLDKFVAGCS